MMLLVICHLSYDVICSEDSRLVRFDSRLVRIVVCTHKVTPAESERKALKRNLIDKLGQSCVKNAQCLKEYIRKS